MYGDDSFNDQVLANFYRYINANTLLAYDRIFPWGSWRLPTINAPNISTLVFEERPSYYSKSRT